jgi:hypothetical protein
MIYTHLDRKDGKILVKDARDPNATPVWVSPSELIAMAKAKGEPDMIGYVDQAVKETIADALTERPRVNGEKPKKTRAKK